MRRKQTISRAGFASVALGLGLLGLSVLGAGRPTPRGSARKSAPAQSSFSKLSVPDASSPEGQPVTRPRALPSAIVETLQAVHERLELQPPNTPPQQLEFGPGRLLQASRTHVLLRDTVQGESLSDVSLGTVLAVAHGSDGALFGLGLNGGVRFEPQLKKARAFPHAPFFPDSTLFPDLERPQQFYVYYPAEQALLRYMFEVEAGALLPIEARIPVEGCVSAPAQLRDGALACRTRTGFARRAPRGARTDFNSVTELGQPFRLLPAKRLDELYAVDRGGEVRQVRLAPGAPVLAAFKLPLPPFAAAANSESLAFILVSAPEANEGRRWSLLVTSFEGQTQMEAELPSPPAPADDDWAKTLALDKNLAISEFEPLVAVGGAAQVTVWDYHERKLRFER